MAESFQTVGDFGAVGQEEQQHFLVPAADLPCHLESVYLRHIDVQQYQVGAAEAELLQRLLPVGHVYDFVACFFEEAFQEQRICGVVVGKQDF